MKPSPTPEPTMKPSSLPMSKTLAALAIAGTAACVEVPDEDEATVTPRPGAAEATQADLVELLAPDFDLDKFLSQLAGGCQTCEEYCGGPPSAP